MQNNLGGVEFVGYEEQWGTRLAYALKFIYCTLTRTPEKERKRKKETAIQPKSDIDFTIPLYSTEFPNAPKSHIVFAPLP
jgi:hypothetical protein